MFYHVKDYVCIDHEKCSIVVLSVCGNKCKDERITTDISELSLLLSTII